MIDHTEPCKVHLLVVHALIRIFESPSKMVVLIPNSKARDTSFSDVMALILTTIGCQQQIWPRVAVLWFNVVDTVPIPIVLASMYCTGTYIDIETPMFRTNLNSNHVPAIPTNFRQYRLVLVVLADTFFFFLNFYKDRMITYLY